MTRELARLLRRPGPLNVAAIVGIALLPAPDAFAKGPDARAKAEAQKLYTDGARDMEAEAYSRACPKIEAAWKILPDHIRTGLTLAECFDKWGKPASALEVLEQVAPVAKARGDKAKTAEIEASMVELDKRVPRLTIKVSEKLAKTPGLAILRSERPVPSGSWGTPVPLDPGDYEIEATAVNQPAWTTNVHLEVGNVITVEVTPGWNMPELIDPRSLMISPTTRKLRTAGFVGIGVGALGLAAWGVLGGMAISKNDTSKAHCASDNRCDDEGFRRRHEAISLGHGATAGLIAGGVFAAAGISLVVVATSMAKKETKRDGWAVTNVWLGPTSFGARGSW